MTSLQTISLAMTSLQTISLVTTSMSTLSVTRSLVIEFTIHTPLLITTLIFTSVSVNLKRADIVTLAVASASTMQVSIVNKELMSPDFILATFASLLGFISRPLMTRSSVRYQFIPGADTSFPARTWKHLLLSNTNSSTWTNPSTRTINWTL